MERRAKCRRPAPVPQIGVGVPAGRPDRRQADFERLHKYLREIAYID
jgi:hypothetical protein